MAEPILEYFTIKKDLVMGMPNETLDDGNIVVSHRKRKAMSCMTKLINYKLDIAIMQDILTHNY